AAPRVKRHGPREVVPGASRCSYGVGRRDRHTLRTPTARATRIAAADPGPNPAQQVPHRSGLARVEDRDRVRRENKIYAQGRRRSGRGGLPGEAPSGRPRAGGLGDHPGDLGRPATPCCFHRRGAPPPERTVQAAIRGLSAPLSRAPTPSYTRAHPPTRLGHPSTHHAIAVTPRAGTPCRRIVAHAHRAVTPACAAPRRRTLAARPALHHAPVRHPLRRLDTREHEPTAEVSSESIHGRRAGQGGAGRSVRGAVMRSYRYWPVGLMLSMVRPGWAPPLSWTMVRMKTMRSPFFPETRAPSSGLVVLGRSSFSRISARQASCRCSSRIPRA